jgi:hypothetical protein
MIADARNACITARSRIEKRPRAVAIDAHHGDAGVFETSTPPSRRHSFPSRDHFPPPRDHSTIFIFLWYVLMNVIMTLLLRVRISSNVHQYDTVYYTVLFPA